MALNQWLVTASTQKQLDTYTPGGTIEADDLFILTIAGFDGSSEVISVAAGGTTVADVTLAVTTAWNNSTGALASTITAVDNTTNLTLEADTAGVAFKVTQTTTEANGDPADAQTFSKASTTANGGPNDWQDANNWSEGTVPGAVASEETVIENSAVEILYGLDNSGAAQTLTSLTIKQTYTGKIGWNEASGEIGDYLQIKATDVYIGQNFDGSLSGGSGRIKIDTGTVQSSIIVYNTGNSSDTNKPALRLLCNNAATIIREIRKGSVGLAFLSGETSTILSVLLSYASSKSKDASISIGAGTTLTTYDQIGGQGTVKCATTTITAEDGTLLLTSGAVTTLNVDGADVTAVTPDLITTCNVLSGICDFTQSAVPRTVTTLTVGEGATLKIDEAVVTLTNNIQAFAGGRLQYRVSGV